MCLLLLKDHVAFWEHYVLTFDLTGLLAVAGVVLHAQRSFPLVPRTRITSFDETAQPQWNLTRFLPSLEFAHLQLTLYLQLIQHLSIVNRYDTLFL